MYRRVSFAFGLHTLDGMSELWAQLIPPIRSALDAALRAHVGPPSEEKERALVSAGKAIARLARKELRCTDAQAREVQLWFLKSVKAKQPQPIHDLTCRKRLVLEPETPPKPERVRHVVEPAPASRRDRLPFTILGSPEGDQ